MTRKVDIESAREALDTAEEAYSEILDALDTYEDDGDESEGLDLGERVAVAEGAILDFRKAIGDPDPSVRLAEIGQAFLDECADRCFRESSRGNEESRSAGRDGLAGAGFRALVRRFLP